MLTIWFIGTFIVIIINQIIIWHLVNVIDKMREGKK